jgi:hypothetical protein
VIFVVLLLLFLLKLLLEVLLWPLARWPHLLSFRGEPRGHLIGSKPQPLGSRQRRRGAQKSFLAILCRSASLLLKRFIASTSCEIQLRVLGSRGEAEGLSVGLVGDELAGSALLEGGGKTLSDVFLITLRS